MYPFTQSVNPAVRSHIDAQIAFFNELSETMSRSFQKGLQLNMQLGQTLLAEAASTGQRMLTATERPTARAPADDVTRATVEETDKGLRRQEETTKRSRDAFRQEAERAIKTGVQFQGNLQSSVNGAGGKPDGQVSSPNVSGNMQADNKIPSPLR